MSRSRFLTVLVVFFLLGWGMSCQSPSSADKTVGPASTNNPSITPTGKSGIGTLRLTIKDGPADKVQKIIVWMTEVRVHQASEQEGAGFISVWTPPSPADGELDILVLEKEPMTIAANVTAGEYNQIRISLKEGGKIYFEGKSDPSDLSVPSDEIKIPLHFTVPTGGWAEIVLDFDAEKSLHVVQKGKNSTDYLLRPVINPVTISTSAGS